MLDFSKNREWLESEEMNEISRILWKVCLLFFILTRIPQGFQIFTNFLKNILQIVGERCTHVEKFIIPKELTYRSKINIFLTGCSTPFFQLNPQHCDSEWFLPHTADPEEKYPKQYVPQRNWQKLPLSSGIGYCRG